MQQKSDIDKDATIYHYQLVRKIHFRSELLASYIFIALLLCGFQFLFYQVYGIITWATGLIVVVAIHWVIIRLTMIREDEPEDRRWGWHFKLPWIGYLPIQYAEHQLFRRIHQHLTWLGLCAIAVGYPWASGSLMISLIIWHFWLLAPRIVMLRKLRKARKDGLIRIEEQIVSFYHR